MSLSTLVHTLLPFISLSVPGTFGVGILFGLAVWIEKFLKELSIKVSGGYLKEGLQAIEVDHGEYTLDGENMMAQKIILERDRTKKNVDVLEKSLSRWYPDLRFHEALQEEKEKLQIELHRSQVDNDPKQCLVTEHLIEVTESVVNVPSEELVDAHAYRGC